MHTSTGKIDFGWLAQSREFAEFSALLHNLVGMTIAIYDPSGEKSLTVFSPDDESPLCRLIHSTGEGWARCAASNRLHFAEAVHTRQACRYQCHAGLVDIAIPVFADGTHVATISTGQLLPMPPSVEGFRSVQDRLHGLPLSERALRKVYDRAPYLEESKLDAAIKLLTFFVDYLVRMGLTLGGMAARLEHPKIAAALRYVEDHFRERLAIADVSREVHLSPDHFSTVFRQATGRTFVAHVQQRRVEEAKVLLTATRKSVTEISLHCGFTNLTHFNRVFRRWTGKSPRQYRNESPTHAGGVCTEWTDERS
jgi:AraC-like DNA-binding protein/ligand-binding sensor protein